MTALNRLRELLSKAEPGSVQVYKTVNGLFAVASYSARDGIPGNLWCPITQAEFAQLKTEFPNVWRKT